MNTRYDESTHNVWVEKVKGLFPAVKIDEGFRGTNSYIEITERKSETVKLGLKLSFKSEEEKDENGEKKEKFTAFGHITCVCGSLSGIRRTRVLDVLGWDQAISDFQTIKQQVYGSATYPVVDKLFDSLKSQSAA